MILAYESPDEFAKRRDPAAYNAYMDCWRAFGGSLQQAGVLRSASALLGPETATCISVKDGKRQIQDGPFTDSKEQLGGFFVIEVASLEEAANMAKTCPSALSGRVDVRVIPEYGQGENS
jgi:hypothetical protein